MGPGSNFFRPRRQEPGESNCLRGLSDQVQSSAGQAATFLNKVRLPHSQLWITRQELARSLQNVLPNSSLCRFGNPQSFRAMKTSLSLLTREGAVDVTFAAVLTPEQYARFFECVQAVSTKAEMKACVDQFANEFDLEVAVDDPCSSPSERLMRQPR
jgi:hypothetical protein